MLSERNFPAIDVRLLDDDESIGQLEATGDEINFIQSLRARAVHQYRFHLFFCCMCRKPRRRVGQTCTRMLAVRDRRSISGALENGNRERRGSASLWVSAKRGQIWQPEFSRHRGSWVAHPAAIALRYCSYGRAKLARRFVTRLPRFSSPLPNRDQERHGRTTPANREPSILPIASQDIFGRASNGFNMVARYGSSRVVA